MVKELCCDINSVQQGAGAVGFCRRLQLAYRCDDPRPTTRPARSLTPHSTAGHPAYYSCELTTFSQICQEKSMPWENLLRMVRDNVGEKKEILVVMFVANHFIKLDLERKFKPDLTLNNLKTIKNHSFPRVLVQLRA